MSKLHPTLPPCLLLSMLCLLSAPASAGVLVVDAAGGGAFTQIQSAIDAAQDGDVLLVKTGAYASFVVNDKELAIVGDTGANVRLAGAVRVRNLAAQKTLVIANVDATGVPGTSSAHFGLYAVDNAGHLRIENGSFVGSSATVGCSLVPGYDAIRVESSHDVSLLRCSPTGGAGSYGGAGAGVRSSGSTVLLFQSQALGGKGLTSVCDNGPPGAPGVAVSGPLFLAYGSSATGGHGGHATVTECTYGGAGGDGLVIDAGTTAALRASGPFTGGTGGQSHYGAVGCSTLPPGPNGSAIVGAYTTFASSSPRMMEVPTPVRESTTPLLHFVGKPDDRVGLFVSLASAQQYQPARQGVLLVETSVPQPLLWMGVIPASGVLDVPLALGDLGPGVQEKVLHVQALFVDTQYRQLLANPSTLVVLDSAF